MCLKLLKLGKKTILEAARGKQYITYKGKTTSITEDFSSEPQKPKPVITSPMLRKKEVLTRNSVSVKTSLLRPYKGIFRWMKMKRILCQYASVKKKNANSNFFFFGEGEKLSLKGMWKFIGRKKKEGKWKELVLQFGSWFPRPLVLICCPTGIVWTE